LAQLQPDQPFGTQTAITGPDFDFTWGGGSWKSVPESYQKSTWSQPASASLSAIPTSSQSSVFAINLISMTEHLHGVW